MVLAIATTEPTWSVRYHAVLPLESVRAKISSTARPSR